MGFIKFMQKLFGKNNSSNNSPEKEAPRKESVASFSMKDGDHGTIFGINKKIVSGIFILICTVFAIAFITATDSPSEQEQRAEIDPDKIKPASDGSQNVGTGLPDGYGSYINENIKKAEEARSGKRQREQQQAAAEAERRRKQQEELERKRAEEEAKRRLAQPSAAQQAVNQPNYVAQQQAALAAQMRAIEAAQAGNLPKPAPSTPVNSGDKDGMKSAIEMYRSSSGQGNPNNSGGNNDSGSSGVQTMTASNGASSDGSGDAYKMVSVALKPNMLQAGTVMPAVLCTGINSNVDGQVTAMIQKDIYDSLTGNNVLIPAGSRLMGSYDGKAASGSGRVTISFTTLIFPDGTSYPISNNTFMAMDGEGYTGVKGKVDHHTDRAISVGAIGAGIAALGSIAAGNTSTKDNYTAGQLASQGALASMINTTSSILSKSANVSDTVSVKPGHSFMIYLAQPVQF